MKSSPERTALLFLAGIALAGGTVRVWRAHAAAPLSPAQGTAALERQLQAVDSAKRAAKPKGGRKPRRRDMGVSPMKLAPRSLRPGLDADSVRAPAPRFVPFSTLAPPPGPLDLDTADSVHLVALPGIGPTLAHRILADRRAKGPFGAMDALKRVRGVTTALAKRLDSLVTFSGPRRPLNAVLSGGTTTGAGPVRRGRRRPP